MSKSFATFWFSLRSPRTSRATAAFMRLAVSRINAGLKTFQNTSLLLLTCVAFSYQLEITEAAQFEETEMPEEMSEYLNHNDEEYLLAKRQKNDLRRIWEEVKTFPTNQRKVLLLSLKESRGVEAVTLLLKKRIASIREIADALEISKDEFFELFIRLPMTSREISDFLGIEDGEKTTKEQKVDNLRSTARNLLRRRLGIRQ